MKILLLLIEKEFKQFFRNAFLPKMIIAYPLLVMLVIPLVTNMDVRNVKVCIVDTNHSMLSNQLIDKIDISNYFQLTGIVNNYQEALKIMEKGNSDVILQIPDKLDRQIQNNKKVHFEITANAVNGSKGLLGSNYISQIVQQFKIQLSSSKIASKKETINAVYLYNPLLNQKQYMIPALVVVLLILMCGLLPALNIVLEKEKGTIEQLNVSPVSKKSFILAKLIPYWLMGLVILSICFIIIRTVWGMSPIGSYFSIYLAALLLILIMSGIGLTISNYSNTLQQALFVIFFIVMIFILLSGLFTPIKSMPNWANHLSQLLPPRYFVEIIRNVYLKGSSILDQISNYIVLLAFSIVINILAVMSYRKQN